MQPQACVRAGRDRPEDGWIMIRTVVREPAAVPVTVELAFENQRAHHVTLEPGIHSASPEPLCQTVGPVRMFLKYDGPLAAPTGAVFRGADSKTVLTTSVTALVVKFDSNGCPRAKSRVIGEPSSGEAQPTWENRCVRMLALRYRDISVGDVVLYSRNGRKSQRGLPELITRVTKSDWYHCGCIGRSGRRFVTYEATPNKHIIPNVGSQHYLTERYVGVWCMDLLQVMICDLDELRFLRVPTLTNPQSRRLDSILSEFVGTPYDNLGLAVAGFKYSDTQKQQRRATCTIPNRVFCSQMVILALQCATADDPNWESFAALDPQYISPGEISELWGGHTIKTLSPQRKVVTIRHPAR